MNKGKKQKKALEIGEESSEDEDEEIDMFADDSEDEGMMVCSSDLSFFLTDEDSLLYFRLTPVTFFSPRTLYMTTNFLSYLVLCVHKSINTYNVLHR